MVIELANVHYLEVWSFVYYYNYNPTALWLLIRSVSHAEAKEKVVEA